MQSSSGMVPAGGATTRTEASSRHALPVRVYYEDTDFSGFVYHASYLRFMERGRTEWLRALAVAQRELQATGTVFVVRRMTIDYRAPARMDDLLIIATRAVETRGASLRLAQEVRREGAVLVAAEVTVAAVREGRAARLPESLRRALDGG